MRYVVATARAPFSHDRVDGKDTVKQNVGGVVTGLRRLMRNSGGTWVCWGDGQLDREHRDENHEGYKISRIILDKNEKKGFYDDYCNGTLWPLFHYFREKIKTTRHAYDDYVSVNRKFAERIVKETRQDSVVWVHDYQLSLVPGMIKQLNPAQFVVTTWHIPWVAGEFFSILPQSREIQASLSSSDLISFHTRLYVNNFISSQEQLYGSASNIRNKVLEIPLGIDDQYYRSANEVEMHGIRKKTMPILFSIDRLDYTKGLKNRVLAIEYLLTMHPSLKKRFRYVMMVTPSRTTVTDYIQMKRELEMNIGRVNGKFGDEEWMPIIYMYRKISDNKLKNSYRTADVALITPLIDGLNLVSKEFVAASNDGVLILSKFAGSSEDLTGALLVNPYDFKEVASAIFKGLTMNREEKKERLVRLKDVVRRKNVGWWISRIEKEVSKRWIGDAFTPSGLVDN